MNLKIFYDGTIDEDWEIDTKLPSLRKLYEELLFELEQYADQSSDDSVIIHDKTAYQLLVVLKTFINKKGATEEVLNDLVQLARKEMG